MARIPKIIQLPSGHWHFKYSDASGKRRRATFEKHNDAVAALSRRLADAHSIRVGEMPAPPPHKTFDDLCVNWMQTRAVHKRSADDDRSRIKVHLLPAFGGLALREVTYERIEQFKAARANCAPQTLRHFLNLLGAMLKHAHRLKWIVTIPPIDRPKVKANGQDYSYLRSAGEVQRFLRAARADGNHTFALYATALYTGMRQGELAALTWDRVDFAARIITVGGSFDGPTKSGDVRPVPILDALLPVLRELRLSTPGGFLFPTSSGKMHQPKDRIFCERFHRVLTAAGFDRPTTGRQLHYIRFHDLRHTFASMWMAAGGDLFKLQKILGHKSTAMTLRYAHLSPAAFAGDWGRFNALAIDDGADVLPLRAGGR